MTKRKELIQAILTALNDIGSLELVDIQKGQFDDPTRSDAGQLYTAALLEIGTIEWGQMTNGQREGEVIISVYLYVKDGFSLTFKGAPDTGGGLVEIELIDNVITAIDGFTGNDLITPLKIVREGASETNIPGIMAYKLDFSGRVYKDLNQYTRQQIRPTPKILNE